MTFATKNGSQSNLLRIRHFSSVEIFRLPAVLSLTSFGPPTFIDAEHGWLVADRSRAGQVRTLYRTVDGGATWTIAYKHNDAAGGPGAWTDANIRWIMAIDGRSLLGTTDGGRTWRASTLPAPPGATGEIAHFQIAAHGDDVVVWSGVLETGSQYRTFFDVSADGGRAWTNRPGPAGFERPNAQNNLFDATDGSHWVLVSGREVRVTDDVGLTWQTRAALPLTGSVAPFPPLRFPTPDVGWIMTSDGRILRTTDGGHTWTDVTG